jgi:hypothetical protein
VQNQFVRDSMKIGCLLTLAFVALSLGAPELYGQEPITHKVPCGSIRIGVTSMNNSNRGVGGDCAPLEAAQLLADLNRAQPRVTVTSVVSEKSSPSTAAVTLEVLSTTSSSQRTASGAYDLHLFRDGQVVRLWPMVLDAGSDQELRANFASEISTWRRRHLISLVDGKKVITFHGVPLPQRKDVKSVIFTAYAFNSDRVKSATSPPFEYQLPVPRANTPRRAYVITVGVNANESHFNLEMAVPSAQRAGLLLAGELRNDYSEIHPIALYSNLAEDSAQVVVKNARKANLKAVLDLLAGRPISPRLRKLVDPDHVVRSATPDDAVVLYVASHGYMDPHGTFFLFPYDTGTSWGVSEASLSRCEIQMSRSAQCSKEEMFLEQSISSMELANWWSGIDAGELDMILDTCHSGAAPGKGFRAAPLGDPGLGQLSYDKRMRIVVAAQPAQTDRGEWIGGEGGRTLLVEALDGAKTSYPDAGMSEWFIRATRLAPLTEAKRYPDMKLEDVQAPQLLDFSKYQDQNE